MATKFVNTTIAAAAFAFLLVFGFVWTTYNVSAPYSIFVEGLWGGLLVVTGKRLVQKWQGKKRGFAEKNPEKDDTNDIPIR